MSAALQFVKDVGFITTYVNRKVAQMVLGTSERLTLPGINSVFCDCSFQDLRYLREGGFGMKLDNEIIVHWEFPNFSTLDVPLAGLNELYIKNSDEVIVFGDNPTREIGYVANKSDGNPYNMFSCFAGQWFSFAHYKRKLYFLGEGYRVGHVEVVGAIAGSNHYQGDILLNGLWQKVMRKPLFSQPDFQRGHKEGVILEIEGIEYRVKIENSHDLRVVEIRDDSVIVATQDLLFVDRYRLPDFFIEVNDIVECYNTHVLRRRVDKKVAELKPVFDRIEKALDYCTLLRHFKPLVMAQSNHDRIQLKPVPRLIMDGALFAAAVTIGQVSSLISQFPQYDARDIARTVQCMGTNMESLNYSVQKRCYYEMFCELYDQVPIPQVRATQVMSQTKFVFDFSELRATVEQDQIILRGDDVVRLSNFVDVSESLMFEAAIQVVEVTPAKLLRTHSKLCEQQILKYSAVACPLCIYNESVKYLVNRMSSYASSDVNVSKYGLYRRNTARPSVLPEGRSYSRRLPRNRVVSCGVVSQVDDLMGTVSCDDRALVD